MTKSERNPNPEIRIADKALIGAGGLFPLSAFGLLSDFGFRASDFTNR
jgi:hypothetical protein